MTSGMPSPRHSLASMPEALRCMSAKAFTSDNVRASGTLRKALASKPCNTGTKAA